MRADGVSQEDYLQAFMSGFDFVLLAMRGRLAEADLPDTERDRIETFLADYWRISRAFHERHEAPVPSGILVQGPVLSEVPSAMVN